MLARLLFFCGLFMASTSAVAMTIYKSNDANGVVSYSDRPTKGAQVFVFRDRMVEHLERQVYLDHQEAEGHGQRVTCAMTCMRRSRSN